MAEILKEWLTERLQRPITWEASAFGNMMKNGYVVAGVLLSYGVINEEEYFMIRSDSAPEDIKNNWKYLKEWLHSLEVHINASDLEQFTSGNSSSLLRLFYQLFLHLDKRDRTNFIKREKKMVSTLVEKVGHRFKVDNVPDEKESFVEDLARPLLNEKHFIEWQRKKSEQIKESYDYLRHKYSKMVKKIDEKNTPMGDMPPTPKKLSNKERKQMEEFSVRYPCKFENYTYDQLVTLENKALEHKQSIAPSDWAKNYMENLLTRLHKKADSEEFQKQLSHVISSSMWDMSIGEEETKLDTEIAKKVMKLSQFEKQMCTQIMETKQQARNLFQNRLQAEKEYSQQREHQFNQFLDNVKEQIHLEVEEIDFEKKRQKMLHSKLYAEKMRRKRKQHYEICYDTVLGMVDYATKCAYYGRLIQDEIPAHFIHEWKNLFYKRQPIFDILEPMENILKDSEEEQSAVVEEIVRLELDRQEALNSAEFEEYQNYTFPWDLDLLMPNYDPNSEERLYEYLGMRILGHVVYTLLEIKYPYPPVRPAAELPSYTVKALLRCLPDRSLTVPMQILLNSRKIHVVRLETAINFCLRKFKAEMLGCTDIELSFDKFATAAQDEEDKEFIKLLKMDDDVSYKSVDVAISSMLGVIPANTKLTQTPKTIPEEEIVLSTAAELGRYTYESLNAGDSLTDHLLAAMIVEYIKNQDDIKGFVIVNYPNSYREAQILEEAFLGLAPPDEGDLDDRDGIFLEESIIKHRKKEKDEYKDVRVSRLVCDPHKKSVHKPFESYFTCYIHLKNTEDILQEMFIWELDETNSEFIDRFYAVMGLNYSMYYETFDKDLLVQICKYIIGAIVPMKSHESLFGENVLSLLDLPVCDDRKTKSKMLKPELTERSKAALGSRIHKVSRSSLEIADFEVVKEPSADVMSNEDRTEMSVEQGGEEHVKEIILAGDQDWDYGEIPIPETIGVALASVWEEVENTYIRDMSELFFAKRLEMNCLVPYVRYIKDKMEQIITLPSNKQDFVSNFQKEYNNFENDWRDINLAKNEWHCRVQELQKSLYRICDQRKLHAEKKRRQLICDNWTMDELTNMANTYISCMQTELNRSVMTFQALHDFYFAMIKHMPPTDRLSAKELTRILKESEETSGSKKGVGEDKVYRQLKNSFQELHLHNIEIDYTNNPFNYFIENNVKNALKIIKDMNDSYRILIAREYTEIAKVQPVTKKKENGSDESVNLEEIFKRNALKCVEEWTMGINGELYRATQRILALQSKCYRDMKMFNDHVFTTFMKIQKDIDEYYLNEIKSVDRLCKFLQLAVENGRQIPECLVLEHDTFVIDPNLLLFASPKPPPDTGEQREITRGDMEFKIGQLAALRSQFKIVAPTGIILQQAFIYLLQDFIFFGKESCEGSLFPKAWTAVDPEKVYKLVYNLFGDAAYVDWRDFLILCLNIKFPTLEEILEVRKLFRRKDAAITELVSRNEFIKIPLWYEIDYDPKDKYDMLRKNLTKHFLFELYETQRDLINYPAFLLAFCRSGEPIEGFVMALSLAEGKKISYLLDDCVRELIKLKQYNDACRVCALKCSDEFLEKLINGVIDTCEGFAVTEMEYVAPPDEKTAKGGKSGKGGKGSAKSQPSRKSELPGTNAMKAKSDTHLKNPSRSQVDVKTTYICPPCQEEEEKAVKIVEKVIEEEPKVEIIKPDPNLVYAVSQSVIWNVLRICLPWHFVLLPEERVTPYVEMVTELLKRLEADHENCHIYVCKLVSEPKFCLMLHKSKRFQLPCFVEEISKVFL